MHGERAENYGHILSRGKRHRPCNICDGVIGGKKYCDLFGYCRGNTYTARDERHEQKIKMAKELKEK